jgi:hypothetical protein
MLKKIGVVLLGALVACCAITLMRTEKIYHQFYTFRHETNAQFKASQLLAAAGKIPDLSLEKPLILDKPYKVHLVSYANGNEVYYQNQNAQCFSGINKGIDVFHLWRLNHLDAEFRAKNKKILEQKRGAGYWVWKPYIILKTMEKANEGDVIIYLDAGLMVNMDNPNAIVNLLKEMEESHKEVFIFSSEFNPNGDIHRHYTKRDLLIYFGVDNENYRDSRCCAGTGFLAFKNSKRSREFIQKWLDLCENEQLVTDLPSINPEYPDFRENRHDQSILSLLSDQNKTLVCDLKDWRPFFSYHHRGNPENSLFIVAEDRTVVNNESLFKRVQEKLIHCR